MNYLKIIFVFVATATQLWSQTLPTQSPHTVNDSLMQDFFSTCIPDESQRVIPGLTEISPIPDPLSPQERETHEPPQMQDELRMVHWVHGLGGDIDSWSNAAGAFEEHSETGIVTPRMLRSHKNIEYSNLQSNTLFEVARDVGDEMLFVASNHPNLPETYEKSNSIAIGHSQGGLVVRRIDQHQSENNATNTRFGGLVTFNSPNQGAVMIENHEDALNFAEEFAADMIRGPASEFDLNLYFELNAIFEDLLPGVLDFFFSVSPPELPLLSDKVEDIASFIFSNVLGFFINTDIPRVAEDYRIGATALNELNMYEPEETAILAIASERPVLTTTDKVELNNGTVLSNFPVPISWATLQFFLTESGSYPTFEADKHEMELAMGMEEMRLDYFARYAEANAIYHWLKDLPILDWETRGTFLLGKMADDYLKGANSIQNFNDNYLTVLGLRELDQTIEEEQYCICFSGTDLEETRTGPFPPGTECIPESSNEPGGFGQEGFCYTVMEEIITNNWTILPSDGVLSVETQMDIPQATEDPVIISKDNPRVWDWSHFPDIRTDYGSTHMAIRNDDIGKNALIKLFEGDFGLFFETDEAD